MFCRNCGTENKDTSKFCKQCGSKLEHNTVPVVEQPVAAVPVVEQPMAAVPVVEQPVAGFPVIQPVPQEAPAGEIPVVPVPVVPVVQEPKEKKPFPVMLVAGLVAGLAVIIAIICIVLNVQKTIDLNDYVVFESTGFEGYGKVNATIDWDAIEQKYGDKVKLKDSSANSYATMLGLTTPVDVLPMFVSVKIDENQNLSNGQKVSYTWEIDENALENFTCKLKYKDGTYKVDGLAQVGTFDAFADLQVEFIGIAPNGSVNLNYTGNDIDYYDFSCDRYDGLRNGDVVKVSINQNNLESYAQRLGKIPVVMEKEYTVSGLSSYVEKISDLPADTMAAMDMQAIDTYKAYMANDWADSSSLVSFNYLGEYLLTAKSKDNWGTQNQLYLIYKAQARNVYDTFDKVTDVYWYVAYNNLMVNDDGTMEIDITSYQTPGNRFEVDSGISNGWWGTMSWTYIGYPSLDELYKDVVTSNLESYNHEDNVQDVAVAATPSEEVAAEQADGSEYILPNSNTKRLKKKHLKNLTAEQCKLARNEIYARHGRKFDDEALQSYFNSCSWYNGTIDPEDFDESMLSEIEIANRDFIVQYEEEMGYR